MITGAHTNKAPRSNARRLGTIGLAFAAIVGLAAGPAAAATGNSAPNPALSGPATFAPAAAHAAAAFKLAAVTPAGIKFAVAQPVAAKPAAVKPAAVKPAAAKPAAAKPAAAKPAAAKAAPAKVAAPAKGQLLPRTVTASQHALVVNKTQMKNVAAIVKAGHELKLPPRAYVMAVACAMQESTLHNYGSLGAHNDHDSLGLFQQRPSAGWGSPKQINNPDFSAKSFYKRLVHVDGWSKLPLTRAVQKVQVSAFPDRYAQWEKAAADLVMATYGQGSHAHLAAASGAVITK